MNLFLLLGGLSLCVGLVGMGWLLGQVLMQQGRLLLRLEAIEAGLDKAGPAQPPANAALTGLSIGTSAPPFRLESWQAETLTTVSVDLPARLATATNLEAQDPDHEPVQLAYLIVAHHQPEHLGRLIRALHDVGSYFFIHVDAKSDLAAFQAAVAPFDHVAFASNRVLVKWGRFSVVQAVLTLIQMAVTSGHPFRYYILLSGSDYPIKQKRAIGDHFRNSHRQYMRIDRRLTTDPENTHAHFLKHLPEGRYFGNMTPYHGSMYWSLTADCIHFILDFIEKNPGFLAIHHHIFAPDEVFFHTLLKHSPFADAITQDFSAGCYPDHTSHGNHFIDWAGLRKRDSRLVLDERDFDDLLASDALFARKFDQHASSQLLDLLDTYMHSSLTTVTSAAAQKSTLAATQPIEAEERTNAIRDDSAARAQKTRKKSTVGKSRAWGIQTVYLPRENLRFLEEWLAYHSQLGAEYFYLYDNTGSRELLCGNSVAVNGKNKYGIEVDFRLTDDEIADIEAEIFKKYPVTKVKWQPRRNGEIVYGQGAACDHFSDLVQAGWCAFIDMDEFLYSPYAIGDILEGKAIVLLQKKFDDRFRYETALEITKTFSMRTNRWGKKFLINMEHFIKGAQNIHNLNVYRLAPLISNMEVLRFNHYNHNRVGHEWLLRSYERLDPNWRPVPFEEVFTERCEEVWTRSKRIDYSSFVPIPLLPSGSVY